MTASNRLQVPHAPESPPGSARARDAEEDLLAAIIGRQGPMIEAGADVAGRLLIRFGSLAAVLAAGDGELSRLCSLTQRAIDDLRLFGRVAAALAREEAGRRPVIASWTALLAYVRAALAGSPREQFRVLYLDRKNNLLRDEWIADGSVNHAPVYPREVLRRALEVSASALILVHNHPSGDPTPSRADIDMTRQIIEGARVFSLQVHDHLIVGRGEIASFKQLGLI